MADLSLIPDADWREAERRAAVIRPLTELERRPRHPILAAAALGLGERQTYTLVRRCLDAGGELQKAARSEKKGSSSKRRTDTTASLLARCGSLQRTLAIRCSRL